jgi:Pescadillo N-terminus
VFTYCLTISCVAPQLQTSPTHQLASHGALATKGKGWCCKSLCYTVQGNQEAPMLSCRFSSVVYTEGCADFLPAPWTIHPSRFFLGIFPREPRHRKRANKGSSAPTSFYYAKDIAYLAHEPILKKLREHKAFAKKLARALGRGEWSGAKSLEDNKPVYRLDHIIKER